MHHEIDVPDASPESRPGVPMEATEPSPAIGARRAIAEQQGGGSQPVRAGLEERTPVFGTAQPVRGLSGLIRRRAYRIPEHYGRHWALLMLADRVDVIEGRLGTAVGGRMRDAGMPRLGARVERNPLLAAGLVVGAAWVAKKLL
jgi:hypothetical protein